MGAGVDSDNWISATSDQTSAKPQRRRIILDDDEVEQNLIDTYYNVITIKKHGVVSL